MKIKSNKFLIVCKRTKTLSTWWGEIVWTLSNILITFAMGKKKTNYVCSVEQHSLEPRRISFVMSNMLNCCLLHSTYHSFSTLLAAATLCRGLGSAARLSDVFYHSQIINAMWTVHQNVRERRGEREKIHFTSHGKMLPKPFADTTYNCFQFQIMLESYLFCFPHSQWDLSERPQSAAHT